MQVDEGEKREATRCASEQEGCVWRGSLRGGWCEGEVRGKTITNSRARRRVGDRRVPLKNRARTRQAYASETRARKKKKGRCALDLSKIRGEGWYDAGSQRRSPNEKTEGKKWWRAVKN